MIQTCTMSIPHPTTTCALHYLERRSSHLATAPYQQHRPVKQKLSDAAMRLDPTTWVAPAILRAHDVHEYKKDRRKVEEQYRSYRHEQVSRSKGYSKGENSGFDTDASTSPTTGTMTMTSSTMVPSSGRASAIGARGEMSFERARALEWAGSTSVFSPGVLQEWMIVSDGMDWGREDGNANSFEPDPWALHEGDYTCRFGPDPWALRPMEEMH